MKSLYKHGITSLVEFANLKNLPETAPRMGLAFGDFGLGKTVGLERIAAQENAILLRSNTDMVKELFAY